MAAGAPELAITSVNGGSNPTAGTAFSVTVAKQDQFGHAINAVAATGVSLSLNTGTGTLGGTLTGTIAAGTSSTTINGVTYTKAESGVVLTATRTSGDTPLPAGNSAGFTVNPGALATSSSRPRAAATIGTQTAGTSFNVRVTARDANGNTVTSFNGAGNTVNITSTGTLSAGSGTTAAFTNGVLASHAVTISNTGSFTITATRTSGGAQNGDEQLVHRQPRRAEQLPRRSRGRREHRHPDRRHELQRPHHRARREQQHGHGLHRRRQHGRHHARPARSPAGSGTTATFTERRPRLARGHGLEHRQLHDHRNANVRRRQNGTSNSFTVNPGALRNFLVEAAGGGAIGTQTAGSSFNVRVTARDANNNTVTGFTGTVDITSTGTLSAGWARPRHSPPAS